MFTLKSIHAPGTRGAITQRKKTASNEVLYDRLGSLVMRGLQKEGYFLGIKISSWNALLLKILRGYIVVLSLFAAMHSVFYFVKKNIKVGEQYIW